MTGSGQKSQKRDDGLTSLEQWQHMARAENKRAQRSWQGRDNDHPVNVARLTPETGDGPCATAKRSPFQQMHLEGQAPEEIATDLKIAEGVVWKDLRGLYREGKIMSDAWHRLRVARIKGLKEQGLTRKEIGGVMGISANLVDFEVREMRKKDKRSANICPDTGKRPHGVLAAQSAVALSHLRVTTHLGGFCDIRGHMGNI